MWEEAAGEYYAYGGADVLCPLVGYPGRARPPLPAAGPRAGLGAASCGLIVHMTRAVYTKTRRCVYTLEDEGMASKLDIDEAERLLRESRELVYAAILAEDQEAASRIMSRYFRGELSRAQALELLRRLSSKVP